VTPRLTAVGLSVVGSLILTACEARQGPADPTPPATEPAAAPAAPPVPRSGWRPGATIEESALTYVDDSGRPVLTLACVGTELRVSVPGFRKIGSEDRLTVGAGDEAFALVADLASVESGVVADGAIPPDLIDRIAQGQPVGAIYGTQTLDTVPGPDEETSRAFVSACRAK